MGRSDLAVGVVTGIVAALIWALITWEMRRRRLEHDFGPLAGRYRMTRKFGSLPEHEIASIVVDGHLLVVDWEQCDPGRVVHGEIEMNEQFPRSGRGHYDDNAVAEQLWGFWDVQVKDPDTILVHTTYATDLHTSVVSGFVWSRISDGVDPSTTEP